MKRTLLAITIGGLLACANGFAIDSFTTVDYEFSNFYGDAGFVGAFGVGSKLLCYGADSSLGFGSRYCISLPGEAPSNFGLASFGDNRFSYRIMGSLGPAYRFRVDENVQIHIAAGPFFAWESDLYRIFYEDVGFSTFAMGATFDIGVLCKIHKTIFFSGGVSNNVLLWRKTNIYSDDFSDKSSGRYFQGCFTPYLGLGFSYDTLTPR